LSHGSRTVEIKAKRNLRLESSVQVEFKWEPKHLSFGEILEIAGVLPLPPYMKRKADKVDRVRYQTVYAVPEGSVAAPTAGLHFTDEILEQLSKRNIQSEIVTLHVGAGTFMPVKSDAMSGHTMHFEKTSVSRKTIKAILDNQEALVAVGTTSCRTLESLYWYGVRLSQNPEAEFKILQWDPYQLTQVLTPKQALTHILNFMDKKGVDTIDGDTQLIIVPGYPFKIVDVLITNFHQPGSTLLLLVAAFIGEDWTKVYDFALQRNFRFLSYGDSSILWRKN